MKVLLLNGSANQKGNTFTALSEIAGQLEKNGIEAEIMQLGNKPVRAVAICRRGGASATYPEREPWQPMNFIR